MRNKTSNVYLCRHELCRLGGWLSGRNIDRAYRHRNSGVSMAHSVDWFQISSARGAKIVNARHRCLFGLLRHCHRDYLIASRRQCARKENDVALTIDHVYCGRRNHILMPTIIGEMKSLLYIFQARYRPDLGIEVMSSLTAWYEPRSIVRYIESPMPLKKALMANISSSDMWVIKYRRLDSLVGDVNIRGMAARRQLWAIPLCPASAMMPSQNKNLLKQYLQHIVVNLVATMIGAFSAAIAPRYNFSRE